MPDDECVAVALTAVGGQAVRGDLLGAAVGGVPSSVWLFPHEAPEGGKQALARDVRDTARVEEVVSVIEDLVDGEVG